jgi:O-antigen ligase
MKINRANPAKYFFLFGLLVLPLFYIPWILDYFLLPRFLFCSLILLLTLFLVKKETFFCWGPFHSFLSAFFLCNVISCFWSLSFSESFFESAKIFISLVFFILCTAFLKDGQRFKERALMFAGPLTIIIAVVAIGQLSGLKKIDRTGLKIVSTLFGNKNLFSSFLFLLLGLNFAGLLYLKKHKFFLALSILAIGFSIFFIATLQTRAVWLAVIMTTLFLLSYFWRRKIVLSNRLFVLSLGGIFLVILLVLIYYKQTGNYEQFISRLNVLEYINNDSGRALLWENTICIIQNNPWFGVGAGNWQFYFNSCGISSLPVADLTTTFQRPHNDFLWVFSELGIPGGLFYTSFLVLPFILSCKRLFSSKHLIDIELAIYTAALLGYLTISFFDFPKERIEHSIFILLIIALIYNKLNFTQGFTLPKNKLLLVFVPLLVLCIICSAYRLNGELYSKKLYLARAGNNFEKMIVYSDKAYSIFYTIDPTSIPIHWYRATASFALADYRNALEDFKLAHKISPYNVYVLNDLGSAYEVLGDHDMAKTYYRIASEIAPQFEDPKLNMAAVLHAEKKYIEALKWADAVQGDSERKKQYKYVISQEIK